MTVKKGQIIEVEITDLAFGGKGLTRVDGMAVFVDQAVPGDRVQARVVKKRRQHAEARVMELRRPSPDRVPAPCPYSGFCGGCKWQFLRYEKQLVYKRNHVAEALRHIGGVEEPLVHATLPAAPIFGYRNKMEFSCSDRRWLLPSEMHRDDQDISFALGLHVPGTFHKVIDTQACLLQPPLGDQILGDVRRGMRASDLPPYGLRSHIGFWRFLMLRHSVARDQWMVNLITSAEAMAVIRPMAEELMAAHPKIVAVVNNVSGRKAAIAVGEYELPVAGETKLHDRIGPYEFEISANSFFQTNTRSAALLYGKVKEYARLSGSESVVDLYSGTGTIAIFLADAAREVTGIEIVASAVQDAEHNCRNNRIRNCRFVLGDIRQQLAALDIAPEVMVIDPPRDGMHKDVLKQVCQTAPQRIIYVSCNPATLARDVSLLKDHYRIAEVQPVDMFPHTWHIESVTRLEKR